MSSERQTGTVKSVDHAAGSVQVEGPHGNQLVFQSQDFIAFGGAAPQPGQVISYLVDDGNLSTARIDAAWHDSSVGGATTA